MNRPKLSALALAGVLSLAAAGSALAQEASPEASLAPPPSASPTVACPSVAPTLAVDASAIAHKVEGKVGPDSELVELVWLPIAEAKSQDLPTITQVALDELQARVAKGFGHDLPSPFYRMLHKKFVRAEL